VEDFNQHENKEKPIDEKEDRAGAGPVSDSDPKQMNGAYNPEERRAAQQDAKKNVDDSLGKGQVAATPQAKTIFIGPALGFLSHPILFPAPDLSDRTLSLWELRDASAYRQ
jgi:hypothetical protein